MTDLQPRRNHPSELAAAREFDLPFIQDHQRTHLHYPREQNQILEHWRILTKRKWAVLATLVIVFTLAWIKALKTTRLYQATSKVAISPENPNILGFKDQASSFYPIDFDEDAALETQVAILRSDALAMKVIETMHLDQDPRFVGAGRASAAKATETGNSSMEPDPGQATALLGAFRGGLTVQLIPNSRLIQISYTGTDPQLAAEIANNLVKTFIEENFKTKYESVTQTSEWLSKELADLQRKVETSQEKLVRYQKDHSILGIDEKQNIVTEKLAQLNQELTAAQRERIEKESIYKFSSSGDPTLFAKISPEASSDNLLAKLQEREADLSTQYAQATTQFGSGYPKVTELANQLKHVRDEIAGEEKKVEEKVRNNYLAALQREQLLAATFEQQKQEANRLNESAIEYSVLKRDADSNRDLYDNLLQRLKEAGVSAGLRSSNIRVVDVARTPTSPIAPNIPRSLAMGFLLGLGGGIALALLLENLDRTVRSMEEISAISTLPALGAIPLQLSTNGNGTMRKRLKRASATEERPEKLALITYSRPKSQAAEAYRSLRTSILMSSFGGPPKVILVTSALPQEGKTTISANSALVLAQRGSKVLLVDADLRRPGIGKLFGLPPGGGLSTLISGVDQFQDVVIAVSDVPNLWVLPAGPIPPHPAELLSSASMRNHLASWRETFDHIIIDSPPCLSVTDAVVISRDADQVILVVRSGQTTKPALRRASEILVQVNARVMGIVLNALNLHSADGYYYSYGGPYGHRYYEEDAPQNGEETTPEIRAS